MYRQFYFFKKICLLLLCLGYTFLLRGQVTFDAASSNHDYSLLGLTNSISQSHTTGTGSNRLMLVAVTLNRSSGIGSITISGVTYGSTALTRVTGSGITAADNGSRVEYWYLINPPSGAASVEATSSSNVVSIAIGTLTFSGVNQTTPLGMAVTGTGNNNAPSLSVTSATNEIVCDAVSTGSTTTATVGASQTSRWNRNTSAGHTFGSTEVGAASVAMSWSLNSTENWSAVAIAIKPTCAAGTTAPTLSSATANNACPANTANLDALHTGSAPSGSILQWFTNNTHSGAAYSTPTTAGAGIYYGFYYHNTQSCYSPATAAVTATIGSCCAIVAPILTAN